MAHSKKTADNQAEQALASAMDKTQDFFERNGKLLSWVIIGVLVIIAAYFGYMRLIAEPRAEKAQDAIYAAQFRFEAAEPDYALALQGDDTGAGFLDVVERYGSTPAGNLAAHYAGVCYVQLGDWDQAAHYLARYKPVKGVPGTIVNAQNYGLRGDVEVQRGRLEQAAEYYRKAAAAADNAFTTPLYLKKGALVAMKLGNRAEAEQQLRRIVREWGSSSEAREAEKYLGASAQ